MQEQIEFIIPDGYIKDEENTTDKKVVYKLKEQFPIAKDWEEVCEIMFPANSKVLFSDESGWTDEQIEVHFSTNKNNLTSKQQGEKLMAINQLMTVAKYLNGLNCFNDSNCDGETSILALDFMDKKKIVVITSRYNYGYGFRSVKRAKKAIEILGEDVVRLALLPNNY